MIQVVHLDAQMGGRGTAEQAAVIDLELEVGVRDRIAVLGRQSGAVAALAPVPGRTRIHIPALVEADALFHVRLPELDGQLEWREGRRGGQGSRPL